MYFLNGLLFWFTTYRYVDVCYTGLCLHFCLRPHKYLDKVKVMLPMHLAYQVSKLQGQAVTTYTWSHKWQLFLFCVIKFKKTYIEMKCHVNMGEIQYISWCSIHQKHEWATGWLLSSHHRDRILLDKSASFLQDVSG